MTERYLRLNQIIGNPEATPPIEPILPISCSTWYRGIQAGIYPRGTKIGKRTVVWRKSDIEAIASQGITEK